MEKNKISLRDFSEEDIPFFLDYFYRSSPEYLDSLCVDSKKLGPEIGFQLLLQRQCIENRLLPKSRSTRLSVMIEGEVDSIGTHLLNQMIDQESAVFHAHIWKPEWRRKGIGSISYLLACEIFLKRFNLKKIIFTTPKINAASNGVKQKMGLRPVGEGVANYGIVKDNTPVWLYELTLPEVILLKSRAGL